MISHTHKFIFIHIPKTGGTSLEHVLDDFGTLLQGPGNFHSIYFKHITAQKLKSMMGDEYGKYFTFSVVRNPWDWLVSLYEFNRGFCYPFIYGTSYSMRVPGEYQKMPFNEWLNWFHDTFNKQQYEIISDSRGKVAVDRVFRFENLKANVAEISSTLGLQLSKEIPRLKGSDRKHLMHYYNSGDTIDFVQKYFAKDIELFGYSFDDLQL